MTIVMRAGKEEEVVIVLFDIDQAIAANQSKLFAVFYGGST